MDAYSIKKRKKNLGFPLKSKRCWKYGKIVNLHFQFFHPYMFYPRYLNNSLPHLKFLLNCHFQVKITMISIINTVNCFGSFLWTQLCTPYLYVLVEFSPLVLFTTWQTLFPLFAYTLCPDTPKFTPEIPAPLW